MSDNPTPRTDAAKLVWQDINGWDRPVEGVGIDFARQLERELDNMTDQRDAAMQALEWAKKSHERELAETLEQNLSLQIEWLKKSYELQLAEAKAEAEKWERLYDLSTDHLSLMQERDNYGPTEELNDTAIRISRELAESRETIADLEVRHAATMLHTQTIVDEANELRKQRDNAIAELEAWRSEKGPDGWWVKHEEYVAQRDHWCDMHTVASMQRDRLAEALREADELLAHAENTLHGDGSDDVTVVRMVIEKALAAVKGGKP